MTVSHQKFSFFVLATILKDAFRELVKNDPLRMAGATAFFTTFALPPILIILLQVLGLVFDPAKISKQLFEKLAAVVGQASMHQVVDTLTALRKVAQNWFVTIGGFLFLIFISTTLFIVIKDSLNQLWRVRVVKKRSLIGSLRSRIQSILIIFVTGLLFGVGVLAAGAQAFLGKYMYQISPLLTSYFNSVLNHLLSLVIVTVWFAIVFRYLPDGRPEWKVALTGAFVTGLLFSCGKLILSWLLSHSNINTLYGASGSIVLLLLFVFYSSLILYFGASFTKIWGTYQDKPIRPLPHATDYNLRNERQAL